MLKKLTIPILSLLLPLMLYPQAIYHKEQLSLTGMLNGLFPLNLRDAVFSVENAYYGGTLNKELFNKQIDAYANFSRGIMQSGDIRYEGQGDEESAKAQCAVFVLMTDSVPIQVGDQVMWHTPFEYNFDDYAGRQDWSSMFVTTLMQTKKGNCHSMPLLYKMIMDTLGEKSWLSMAPNHMYIKAWNKRAGWYNIELTCGDFPVDAWLTASGYIHLDAIRNGVYMDTLSLKQSVALCLTDLAHGYRNKYGLGDGSFILKCCDTVLEHYPHYMNALLTKADAITKLYSRLEDKTTEDALTMKEEMDTIYSRIHTLGYRKMPKEMYFSWLYSLNERSNEYRTKKVMLYKNK